MTTPQKIFIGKISKGLEQYYLPFAIDNDSFPVLINAYSWRGRVKRKRGTSLIGRLQLQASISGETPSGTLANTPISPGTVSITIGSDVYTDAGGLGIFYLSGSAVVGSSINYLSGAFTIPVSGAYTGTYSYFPLLPVMGLRDFISGSNPYPLLLAFDTTYSYQVNQTGASPYFYNVSYYYGTGNPVTWSGENYQQFWTTNYEGALWATNGKPGFHFEKTITAITQSDPTHLMITLAGNTVGVGDYVFLYEITETPVSPPLSLNGVSGKVTASGTTFTILVKSGAYNTYVSGGIIQLLTKAVSGKGDGIRWYNGDPTGETGLNPSGNFGWVNFSPPVSMGAFGFDNLNPQQYYLVGATAILGFKDRLLFFGPWIQSTNDTSATQLSDTVLWSWNGSPYYSSPTPLTSSGQTQYQPNAMAYYVNVTGYGGYISAGTSQQIVTVNKNEDVLLIGFTAQQTRFIYTGNDLLPFLFYIINSEFGRSSTFSGVTFDRGALGIGSYGLALTEQTGSQRIDLSVPDVIFKIQAMNNGVQRVNSARDFLREWVYFTFPYSSSNWKFPTQTLFYNYRDSTWAIFYENYTCHGTFRVIGNNLTWATVDSSYPTWADWTDSWDSSVTDVQSPSTCAGNQQGFVMKLDVGTGEGESGYVTSITQLNPLSFTINSENHCLLGEENGKGGDYVILQNLNGTSGLDGLIGKVSIPLSGGNPDPDNFTLTFLSSQNPSFTGTYIGGGQFVRLSQPLIQTKQFPTYWAEGRKVRLGAQKYLFDSTDNGQVTVNIYLSQDPDDPWNGGPIVPSSESVNNSLVYLNVVYTCPESKNIGLTEVTQNLNNPNPITAGQYQIWHRLNTSLIGDTFQVGITLSDSQMRDPVLSTSDVVLQAMTFDVSPGPYVA